MNRVLVKTIVENNFQELVEQVFNEYKELVLTGVDYSINIMYDIKNEKCFVGTTLANHMNMEMYEGEWLSVAYINIGYNRRDSLLGAYMRREDLWDYANENNLAEIEELNEMDESEIRELCESHKGYEKFDKEMLEEYIKYEYDSISDNLWYQLSEFIERLEVECKLNNATYSELESFILDNMEYTYNVSKVLSDEVMNLEKGCSMIFEIHDCKFKITLTDVIEDTFFDFIQTLYTVEKL